MTGASPAHVSFTWLLVFQGCHLLSATCTELLSRHRRAWIIDSFTIEEENPGPFPYVLGQVINSLTLSSYVSQYSKVYFDL